jgi:hypothetical protein
MNGLGDWQGERSEFHVIHEWLGVEHDRIHVMELWPAGHRKVAGLVAARSAIGNIVRTMPTGSSFACGTCAGRTQLATEISRHVLVHALPSGLAA